MVSVSALGHGLSVSTGSASVSAVLLSHSGSTSIVTAVLVVQQHALRASVLGGFWYFYEKVAALVALPLLGLFGAEKGTSSSRAH